MIILNITSKSSGHILDFKLPNLSNAQRLHIPVHLPCINILHNSY